MLRSLMTGVFVLAMISVVLVCSEGRAAVIHQWKLDEDPIVPGTTTAADAVGALDNGVYTGGVSPTTGPLGIPNAAQFDGSGCIEDVHTNRVQDIGTTLEMWFYLDAIDTSHYLYSECVDGGPINRLQVLASNDILYYMSDEWVKVTPTVPLVTGKWYYAAGTWDGATETVYFHDGTNFDTNSYPNAGTLWQSFVTTYIGGHNVGNDERLHGGLANIRIHDVVLDASTIEANALGGLISSNCDDVDWNDDGVIDDLDLTVLANNWQEPVVPSEDGDANGDGFVDDLDLTALAVCWPSGDLDASAIPEPAMLSLLALGGLAFVRKKHRGSAHA